MMRFRLRILECLVIVVLCSPLGTAQDLAAFEAKVTEFSLDNGLMFIVLERHEAPVVTCLTMADVGSVDEARGRTGLAHLFEHMAFKGTRSIGTRDYRAEKVVLAEQDRVFEALRLARAQPVPDANRVADLESQFQALEQESQSLLVHDEFDEVMQRQGGHGLNASTSFDQTTYFVSLPSNKLELWMSMESDRFLEPVLREFYKEKNVVMEERRMRVESEPVGRLLEEFQAMCYLAHPYGTQIVGYMSDLEALSRSDGEAFFTQFYCPSNLTVAIVGDVDPAQVKAMAQTYFGRIPSGPKPAPVHTTEPEQLAQRTVVLEDMAQPLVLIGYHKGSILHPDDAVFDAITDILGEGRTSRLYRALVRDSQVAMYASAFPGLAGDKYPGLFVFYAYPAQGQTNEDCLKAIDAEITRLKETLVAPEELKKAKTRARGDLIRSLASNEGLAQRLALFQSVTGDWRTLFKQLEAIDRVTAEDIQRVAQETFVATHRTVGMIKTAQVN
ncbi:MAG: insulinase family protein [Phycisphaerae bacterium]|nr:insulinase family protein [Phycisphaerae bacterium]